MSGSVGDPQVTFECHVIVKWVGNVFDEVKGGQTRQVMCHLLDYKYTRFSGINQTIWQRLKVCE